MYKLTIFNSTDTTLQTNIQLTNIPRYKRDRKLKLCSELSNLPSLNFVLCPYSVHIVCAVYCVLGRKNIQYCTDPISYCA